mgnify:CR=1 FL=1
MRKILFVAIAASLLSACQTMDNKEAYCPSHSGMARHAVCIDPAWVLDAVPDGEGEKSKVMVVLNAEGITQLKAKALLTGTIPVALQVGHYFFESYDKKSLTSGFLVLKPFHNRDEALQIIDILKPQ